MTKRLVKAASISLWLYILRRAIMDKRPVIWRIKEEYEGKYSLVVGNSKNMCPLCEYHTVCYDCPLRSCGIGYNTIYYNICASSGKKIRMTYFIILLLIKVIRW